MPDFTPVNSLETKLRAFLTRKDPRAWQFYTPLAAAPLWTIVKAHPELDGSDLVAPPGENPEVCVMKMPTYSFVALYTAECRAQKAMEQWKFSPAEMTAVSAPGYQLLRWFMTFDDVDYIWINPGLKECQVQLDNDMVEILLSRPEPDYGHGPTHHVDLQPPEEPPYDLAPLRGFLSQQPTVRAAWIFARKPGPSSDEGEPAYDLGVLMQDPEDRSLEEKIATVVKALTPVESDWRVTFMMADDQSLRNLSRDHPPFYQSPGFLAAESRT